MSSRYVAFFSYTHDDDAHDDGLLSNVRARLESELRLTLGDREVQIFQDRDDLNPGDVWEARLTKALDEAVYLIPVITPSFFASEFCRKEFLRFWKKAQANPNAARIIPLYWRRHFLLDGTLPAGADEVLEAVKAVQYDDWRDVRSLGISDRAMRQKIEAMALDLALRYGRHSLAGKTNTDGAPPSATAGNTALVPSEVQDVARLAAERRQQQDERYRAEGRIEVDAKIIHGAPDGWLKPGAGKAEWFKDLDIGPEMVVVPGNPAFAIGRFAVTFAEWDAAQAHPEWRTHAGIEPRKASDHGWGRGKQPAIDVSWNDAKVYCAWLSAVTGKTYRLPSAAEWEQACRAGTKTEFWWGNAISTAQANYDGNYTFGNGKKGEYRKRTMPVDSFEPNPWGLYQVHGNVWEWCEDAYDASSRVVRGGSWIDGPDFLRSSLRDGNGPGSRLSSIGFRVARVLSPARTLLPP